MVVQRLGLRAPNAGSPGLSQTLLSYLVWRCPRHLNVWEAFWKILKCTDATLFFFF